MGIASQIGPVANYGGYFEAAGALGRAVYGVATVTGSAKNYGGYFEAKGDSGIGVVAKGAAAGVLCEGDLVVANGGESRFTGDVTCLGNTERRGDLLVKGAYRGDIGPNGGGPLPRPAYDSGWLAIAPLETKTLTHNLRGNPDDYVVDLLFLEEEAGGFGRHQFRYGTSGWWNTDTHWFYCQGSNWDRLTNTEVSITRAADDRWVDKVRLRIWVCK